MSLDKAFHSVKSVFFAGITNKIDISDQYKILSTSLFDIPITIYHLYRTDCNRLQCKDINFALYQKQVEWEFNKQDKANIIIVYFHLTTQVPVNLLEFEISIRVSGKAILVCFERYWKKENMQIVYKKFGVEMVDSINRLREAIVKRLPISL